MNEELTDWDQTTVKKDWHLGEVTCLVLGTMHA